MKPIELSASSAINVCGNGEPLLIANPNSRKISPGIEFNGVAVDGSEGDAPVRRARSPELVDDGRLAGNVRGVVEYGIAEQNDVWHGLGLLATTIRNPLRIAVEPETFASIAGWTEMLETFPELRAEKFGIGAHSC
jgi:hypothetical protein